MSRLLSGVLCANGFRLPKGFLEPQTVCTFVSASPAVFGVNGCCFRKGSVEGSALHLSPSPPGVKVAWIVDMSRSQLYKSSPQKTTHHVVAVGVVFRTIFLFFVSYACGIHSRPKMQQNKNAKQNLKTQIVSIRRIRRLMKAWIEDLEAMWEHEHAAHCATLRCRLLLQENVYNACTNHSVDREAWQLGTYNLSKYSKISKV